MRRVLLLLCFIGLLAANTHAQARLGLDKEIHDFGTLRQSADGVCMFTLTNLGTDTLKITDVKPECGCTASELNKFTLAPGENTTLKLTYSTSNAYGGFEKRVAIYTNTNPAVKSISIKGTVAVKTTFPTQAERTSELLVNKSELLADTIDDRTKMELSVIIYNDSEFDRQISGFVNLPSFLIPSLSEFSISPKSEKEIVFSLDATQVGDYGEIKKYFFIKTNDAITSSKMILFTAFIYPYFEPVPKSKRKKAKWEASQPKAKFSKTHINFGTIGKGSVVYDTILLSNTGKDTLKIKKISSACGCLQVSAENGEIPPGKSVVVTVRFDTINRRDRQRKEAQIILNDPFIKSVVITTDSIVLR